MPAGMVPSWISISTVSETSHSARLKPRVVSVWLVRFSTGSSPIVTAVTFAVIKPCVGAV